jgi:hypothetical protein
MAAFEFTREEHTRLYAVLPATSLEVTLMDRIDPHSALQAAEQILPVLRQALDEPGAEGSLRTIRGGSGMPVHENPGMTVLDARFEKALDALDRGTLALHLAGSTDRYQEQIDHAQQARERFTLPCGCWRRHRTGSARTRRGSSGMLRHGSARRQQRASWRDSACPRRHASCVSDVRSIFAVGPEYADQRLGTL